MREAARSAAGQPEKKSFARLGPEAGWVAMQRNFNSANAMANARPDPSPCGTPAPGLGGTWEYILPFRRMERRAG